MFQTGFLVEKNVKLRLLSVLSAMFFCYLNSGLRLNVFNSCNMYY